MKEPSGEVDIALVGKYVELAESYKSLNEALVHGGIANEVRVNLQHIDSEEIERKGTGCLENVAHERDRMTNQMPVVLGVRERHFRNSEAKVVDFIHDFHTIVFIGLHFADDLEPRHVVVSRHFLSELHSP